MVSARLAGRAVAVAVTVLALGTAMVGGHGAHAHEAPAGDLARVVAAVAGGAPYEDLPPHDQALLDAHLRPASHAVAHAELRHAPAEAGVLAWCFIGRVVYHAVAAAGNTLYTYLVEGSWCSDGTTVDSAGHEWSSGEASGPGWTYHGVQAWGGGVSGNEGRAWSRHRFTLSIAGFTVQTTEPCVRMRGTAAGGLGHDGVCGLD